MKEISPLIMTMAKILCEDENPRIEASYIVDFEHSGRQVCPVGSGEANFEGHRVYWELDSWTPQENCTIQWLEIKFPDYNDHARLKILFHLERGSEMVYHYSVSCSQSSEVDCNEYE